MTILSGGRGRPPARPAGPWKGFPPGRWGVSHRQSWRKTPLLSRLTAPNPSRPLLLPYTKNPHRPDSPRGLFLLSSLFFIRRRSRLGKRAAADTASCSMEGFSARAVGGLTPAKLAETTSFASAHSPEPFLSPSPPLHKKLPTGLAARGGLFFCYLSFSSGDDSVWGKGRPPARPAVPWKSFSPERLGRSPHRQRRRPQAPFGLDKQTTVLNSSNLHHTERGVSLSRL